MPFSTLQDLWNKQSSDSVVANVITTAPGSSTSAIASSGNILYTPHFNSVGSTHWTSLINMPQAGSLTGSPLRIINATLAANRAVSGFLCRLYEIGTLNLTTSTSEFTHTAATFPVTRTKLGQASQPVNLIPVILFTTATSVTAPQLTVNYVDQDGNNVTGTKTWIAPAAATAIGSMYQLPIEDADQAIRDITDINVTVTSSTGAATIYGLEILAPIGNFVSTITGSRDFVHNGLTIPDARAAVATSGTVTSLFTFVMLNQNLSTATNLTVRLLFDN